MWSFKLQLDFQSIQSYPTHLLKRSCFPPPIFACLFFLFLSVLINKLDSIWLCSCKHIYDHTRLIHYDIRTAQWAIFAVWWGKSNKRRTWNSANWWSLQKALIKDEGRKWIWNSFKTSSCPYLLLLRVAYTRFPPA